MKKKFISILLAAALLMMQTTNVFAAMMYALDGRTLWVNEGEIEAYRQVGWYYGKPVTMYSADGRTLWVGTNDIDMYRKVGWYYGKPVLMYALDGRTRWTEPGEVEAYKKVGWYNGKPVTMYAVDGRSKWVGENDVEANKKVGWYTEPMTTIYAPLYDSWDRLVKSKVIAKRELEAYKKVGWYATYSEALYTIAAGRAKAAVNNGDWAKAIALCLDNWIELDSPYDSWLRDIGKKAAYNWQSRAKCPLVITDHYMDNSGSYPELNVELLNLSSKAVVAFRIEFDAYNSFWEPAYYYGSNLISVDMDDYYISSYLNCTSYEDATFDMYAYHHSNRQFKNAKNIRITKIVYSDGTIWSR